MEAVLQRPRAVAELDLDAFRQQLPEAQQGRLATLLDIGFELVDPSGELREEVRGGGAQRLAARRGRARWRPAAPGSGRPGTCCARQAASRAARPAALQAGPLGVIDLELLLHGERGQLEVGQLVEVQVRPGAPPPPRHPTRRPAAAACAAPASPTRVCAHEPPPPPPSPPPPPPAPGCSC
jgi:hypothetical protein